MMSDGRAVLLDFRIAWVIANAVGFGLGGAIAGGTTLAAERALASAPISMVESAAALALNIAAAFAALGAVLGVAQWLVLRQHLRNVGWWVPATIVGSIFGGLVAGGLAGSLGGSVTGVGPSVGGLGFLVAALGGGLAIACLPAIFQWFVLRRHAAGAAQWIPTYLKSMGVGVLIAFPVFVTTARLLGWSLPSFEAWALGGLIAGFMAGALQVRVLIGFIRAAGTEVREERR